MSADTAPIVAKALQDETLRSSTSADNLDPLSISAVQKAKGSDGLYEPLCEWQTRLIELLPGSGGEPLSCNLHIAEIITMEGLGLTPARRWVEYEALSYSWGRPDLTAPIQCNGTLQYIPPALADALLALRPTQKGEPRWIWCDALCINQDDPAEKSHQVQLMLTIFTKASEVIAWLGPSIPGNDAAFKAVRVLQTVKQTNHGFRMQASQTWDVLKPLLGREWFGRTWVRQEVFAARSLELQCGTHSLSFGTFLTFAKYYTTLPRHIGILYSKFEQSPPRWCQRDYSRQCLAYQMVTVLGNGSHFGVSDPRDRVYALLGMIEGIGPATHLGHPSLPRHSSVFPSTTTRLYLLCTKT